MRRRLLLVRRFWGPQWQVLVGEREKLQAAVWVRFDGFSFDKI